MSNKKTSESDLEIVGLFIILAVVAIICIISKIAASKYVKIIWIVISAILALVIFIVITKAIKKAKENKRLREIAAAKKLLLEEILTELHLKNIDILMTNHDDSVRVKSKMTLDNYTDIKYFKETGKFYVVKSKIRERQAHQKKLAAFLENNSYKTRDFYGYVEGVIRNYIRLGDKYKIRVTYTTPSGSKTHSTLIGIDRYRLQELIDHPEYLMGKGEYGRLIREQIQEELNKRKADYYNRVNNIIEFANDSKDLLIVKSRVKEIDELVDRLFDKTVNHIQRIAKLDSEEWNTIDNFIADISRNIKKIVSADQKISKYYESIEFKKIKDTCNLLTESQREFNEYINEKAESISKLFGTRVVRNETENQDVYNYIRAYKKNINPFVAEVSSAVFGSAENDPINYVIKYFYPNRSEYPEQISKLKVLIEEIETLKEAKKIIDNYKKDYEKYIQEVPDDVLANDENGFYSRLGLAIIDESTLTVEYKFTYTSNGGMAQRSFTIPMNEENVASLINELEKKLTFRELKKEQRAMMTVKLRDHIKERDHHTCCICGNSIDKEPNLLLEIDHIIPIAKGGLTKEDNLQTLCWKCNRSKGSKII